MSLINGTIPNIVGQPQSQSVNYGSNATFTVTAYSTVPLSYQWRFNGTNIARAPGSTYTRPNIQDADAGSYSVVIQSQAGSATSLDAVLTLNVVPLITNGPQAQTVVAGQSASFAVAVGGTSPLGYQWQFNGNGIPGATNSSITLSPAQDTNYGFYSVLVTNVAGGRTSPMRCWPSSRWAAGGIALPAD